MNSTLRFARWVGGAVGRSVASGVGPGSTVGAGSEGPGEAGEGVGPGAEGSGNTPEAAGSLVGPALVGLVPGVAEVPGVPVVAGATELVLVPLEAVGGAGVCCAAAQDVTMRATAASRLKARTRNDTVKWVLQEGPAGPRRTDLARTMTVGRGGAGQAR
ncbi:MAG: hypothetical protein H0X20_08995 [Chloroflexi bacterium]|nr:hypothetical protein [Chloroflexota bacterium]MDQ3223524.1 hypothetical protein [Gemmatimonadota bacterium]